MACHVDAAETISNWLLTRTTQSEIASFPVDTVEWLGYADLSFRTIPSGCAQVSGSLEHSRNLSSRAPIPLGATTSSSLLLSPLRLPHWFDI